LLLHSPFEKKNCSSTATYVNYFILPIVVTLMWSGNIGLAIRNLIKEKEKFIEEVLLKGFLIFLLLLLLD
jgi:hypothetical protein